MRLLLSIVLVCSCLIGSAQSSKEKKTLLVPDTLKRPDVKHSVRMAALLSTVLPGAGQVYNHKYWKVPIIYAAFAGLGYMVKINNDAYNNYKQAYIYRTDSDPATIDSYVNKYSAENLLTLKNSYQRSRDFAIIGVAAVYVLNIVDAAVDAHLFTFDVSNNLSLRVCPAFIYTAQNNLPGTGLGLTLKF